MNKFIFIGNLGDDAELKMVDGRDGEIPRVTFSVAVSRKFKRKGAKYPETDWFRVSALGDRFERVAEYLVKGAKVCVEGEIQTETRETDDGKKYLTYYNVTNIELLGGRRKDDDDDDEGRGSRSSSKSKDRDRGSRRPDRDERRSSRRDRDDRDDRSSRSERTSRERSRPADEDDRDADEDAPF